MTHGRLDRSMNVSSRTFVVAVPMLTPLSGYSCIVGAVFEYPTAKDLKSNSPAAAGTDYLRVPDVSLRFIHIRSPVQMLKSLNTGSSYDVFGSVRSPAASCSVT